MHREPTRRRHAVTRGSPRTEHCPTDEDLICLGMGELSPEASRDINRHLDGCLSCQQNFRELRAVFQTCAIAVDEEVHEGRGQYGEFRRALAARTSERQRSSASVTAFLLVAAMLLAAVLPVVLAWTTQSDAETIVERAVARELPASVGVEPDEPLRFRWRPQHTTPPVTAEESRPGPSEATEPTREIVSLLDGHGFNRRDPLSASRLAAWRSGLPARTDRVVRHNGLLYVRTTVQHGQLREVIVVIREDDWRVVGQAWTFLGLGRLQVERLDSDVFASMPEAVAPRTEVATQ